MKSSILVVLAVSASTAALAHVCPQLGSDGKTIQLVDSHTGMKMRVNGMTDAAGQEQCERYRSLRGGLSLRYRQ